MRIVIVEDTSIDSMFGSDSEALEGVDVDASVEAYLDAVLAAVREEYPDAEIEVSGRENGHIPGHVGVHVEVDGVHDSDECAFVDSIRHSVWEGWEWLVNVNTERPKYQYWAHKSTGEVWAVEVNDAGEVVASIGPLEHREYRRCAASEYAVNMGSEDADWFNEWSDEFELWEGK